MNIACMIALTLNVVEKYALFFEPFRCRANDLLFLGYNAEYFGRFFEVSCWARTLDEDNCTLLGNRAHEFSYNFV